MTLLQDENELPGFRTCAGEPREEIAPLAVALLAEAPLVCETLARWLRNVFPRCDPRQYASAERLTASLGAGVRFDLVIIGDLLEPAAREALVSSVRLVCGASGTCPVVVVSAADDVLLRRELLGSGVRGHVSTRMPAAAAAEIVRSVLAGTPPDSLDRILPQEPWRGTSSETSPDVLIRNKLTPRECQVLSLLELGCSNRRIAAELRISENTVMVHLSHLMRKLGATNRTQAVFKASRLLCQPDATPPKN